MKVKPTDRSREGLPESVEQPVHAARRLLFEDFNTTFHLWETNTHRAALAWTDRAGPGWGAG